jgi:hypothetical protein
MIPNLINKLFDMHLIIVKLAVRIGKDPITYVHILAVTVDFNRKWKVPVPEDIIIMMLVKLDFPAVLIQPLIISLKFAVLGQILYPALFG